MKWLFVLFALLLLPRAYCADSDWEEMAQLVEQADTIIQQQSIQLQEANQSLKELNQQLKEQAEQIQKQQRQLKGCAILSTVIVAVVAGMYLKERLGE